MEMIRFTLFSLNTAKFEKGAKLKRISKHRSQVVYNYDEIVSIAMEMKELL